MYLHPKSLYRRILYMLASSIVYRNNIAHVKIHGRMRRLPLIFRELPARVCFTIEKPPLKQDGFETILFIDLNRDAIVYLDGRPYHGYDRFHKRIVLEDLGREHIVCLHVSSTATMGERVEAPCLKSLTYIVVDKKLWRLGHQLKYILEIAESITDNDVRNELLELIRDILDRAYIGSVDVDSLETFLDIIEPTMGTFRELVDELRLLTRVAKPELRIAGFRREKPCFDIDRVSRELMERLEALARKYWKSGCLYSIAHSHIDLVWLWSIHETIDKIARTFLNVLWLIKRYDNVYYIQSSALFYELIKKHYPEIYEMVRECIKKGKWEPVGGMWVEADVVLTGLESLVRQFFYGQRFFMKEFGRKSRIVWLPDSFGFNPVLPQLMKSAGLDTFITHKLLWNKYNRFPYSIFRWRGIDGSEVLALILHGGYDVHVKPQPILKIWRDYNGKELYPKTLLTYGFGDGGGGPTIEHVEKLMIYDKAPILPSIEYGRLEDFIDDLWRSLDWSKTPIWSGELYLEIHRGTYTTNLLVKKLVYSVEKKLRYLETLSSIAYLCGRRYPLKEIDKLWKTLLKHEFHDTLPGTCTYTVYKEVYRELEEASEKIDKMIHDVLDYITLRNGLRGLVVYNPISFSRVVYVELDLPKDAFIIDSSGRVQPIQWSSGKAIVRLELKPLAIQSYRVEHGKGYGWSWFRDRVVVSRSGDRIVVENKYYRIVFRDDGVIESMFDKGIGREVLEKPSNLFIAYDDRPYEWSAWDIDEDYTRLYWVVNHKCKPEVIEEGPLRARIRFKWRFRSSLITVDALVYADKRNIDFLVWMDWNERNILLKTWFYPLVNTDKAYYDVGAGYIERSSHRNTSWDRAKYEVYKHKWVAVRDDSMVFTIISHERNGVSVCFNEVGLSLLKTPIYPNPLSDYGELSTYYSIAVIPGQLDERVYSIAYDVSHEPVIVYTMEQGPPTIKQYIVVGSEDIIIENIKKCHDSDRCIVIRAYNPLNKYSKYRLCINKQIRECYETNILEEDKDTVKHSNSCIELLFKPFEVKTIKIVFK